MSPKHTSVKNIHRTSTFSMNANRDHHVALVKSHLQISNCNAKKSSQTDNHIRLFKHDSVSDWICPITKVMIHLYAQAIRNI